MIAIQSAYDKYCESRFPLPSQAQLNVVESRLKVSLPSDFREFILTFNGGFFSEPRIMPPDEGCPLDRLTQLSGIGAAHPSAELGTSESVSLFDDNDPIQILPIGYTMMGNMLLLITTKEDFGAIFLKKAYCNEFFFLASGIEAFFELLCDPPRD